MTWKGDSEITMRFLEEASDPKFEIKRALIRQYLSEEVDRHMRLCSFKTGEFIFTEGEKSDYLFIVLEGYCKVFKTLENGKTILLSRYEDIEILGEFEIFGDCVAKTNIQALKDTYCLAISVSKYKSLLMADNQFLQFVCRQACIKTERINKSTGINLLYPLELRLAGYVYMMQNDGVFSSNYTRLAEYLGCSHRHLLRTFRLLCDKNILEKRETAYLVKDINVLEQLAGEIYR